MKVGSLMSGIGGMDKGLQDAGWEIAWQVEIDKWRRGLLHERFPEAEQYADVRERRDYAPVDLIAFGSPCQDLSVAGQRQGLEGAKSRLFWAAIAVIRRIKPTWILFENVPGLLSSHQGRDFGLVLWAFSRCGYWCSWRVLDSRYFGVPQRRRRVYLVGHLGTPCPTEILFESSGGAGHTPQGREAGPEVAYTLRSRPSRSGDKGDGGINTTLIPTVSYALSARGPGERLERKATYVIRTAQTGSNGWGVLEGEVHTLDSTGGDVVATLRSGGSGGIPSSREEHLVCAPADTNGVRETSGTTGRLDMPLSCQCADSPRYAGLGDAVTATVARWIGERILREHE